MKSKRQLTVACLAGIAVSVLFYGPALRLSARGVNDFISFYAGARLAGTSDLYSPQRNLEVENAAAGWSSRNMLYCRLPYYAALLWPLGRVPYRTAYWIWEAFSAATLAAFVWFWRIPDRKIPIVACCWSVPMFAILAGGQDVSYLLLWVALSVRWMRQGRWSAAGFIFALCAAKFHLFLMLPVWIAAQKLWKFAAGFATAGAGLLALSFAVGGWDWPVRYVRFLLDPQTNPNSADMLNLHALVTGLPGSGWLEILGTVAVAAAVWTASRHTSFEYGLAAALAGGLLTGRHTYLADCALLVPAALIVLSYTPSLWQRCLAWFLLSPACSLFLLVGPAVVARAALLLFVAGLAWRTDSMRPESRSSPALTAEIVPEP